MFAKRVRVHCMLMTLDVMLPQKILTYMYIAEQCVNEDLKHIDSWLDQYGLIRNHKKTEVVVIGCKTLLRIYKQTILPALDYGCMAWAECGKGNSQRLERQQNQAMRIILSANRKTCTQGMRTKLGLLSLNSRRRFLRLQLVYKIIHKIDSPQQLIGYFSRRSKMHNRSLRDTTLLSVIPTKSIMGESSFQCSAAKEWNALSKHLRELKTLSSFKNNIFKFL